MDYCTAIKIVDEALQRVVKERKILNEVITMCVHVYMGRKVWKTCWYSTYDNEYLCSFLALS